MSVIDIGSAFNLSPCIHTYVRQFCAVRCTLYFINIASMVFRSSLVGRVSKNHLRIFRISYIIIITIGVYF